MRGLAISEAVLLLCLVTGSASISIISVSNNDNRNLPDLVKLLRTVRLHLECLLQCRRETYTKTEHAMCIYRTCTGPRPPTRHTSTEKSHWTLPDLTEVSRPKRWQYSDPLQECSNRNCQGMKGVPFFQCVIKKCMSEDDDEEEERRKRK